MAKSKTGTNEHINKFSEFLEKNKSINFCGEWIIDPEDCKKVMYNEQHQTIKEPSVYFWLLRKNNEFIPLYVGKAGKGIAKRMKEHENGFYGGSKSGVKKHKFLRELLQNKENRIHVFYKKSLLISESNLNSFTKLVFPESSQCLPSSLSNYSVEEEIIISLFNDDMYFPINYLTEQKKNNFFKYLDNKKAMELTAAMENFFDDANVFDNEDGI